MGKKRERKKELEEETRKYNSGEEFQEKEKRLNGQGDEK